MRRTRGVVSVSGALTVACALASCSSPSVKAFVPLRGGCGVARGTPPIPMTLVHAQGGTSAFVAVCVDGHGPYRFMVDSGAPVSLVDSDLAQALNLPGAQPSAGAVDVGCVTARQQVKISRWSMGGISLAAQSVLSAAVPGFGLAGQPAGLIGSDVLSRFGAIKVDYGHQLLTVLAPQGSAPVTASILRAQPPAPAAPPLLVHGSPSPAYLTVLKTQHSAQATSAVAFGSGSSSQFLVDTGSSLSSVAPTAATTAGLSKTGSTVSSPGVGCHGSAATVQSGPWTIGGVSASPRSLVSLSQNGGANSGPAGTIGGDVLSSYGSVVLDYRTGVLWLGAG